MTVKAETNSESPSVSELFDPSPVQEVGSTVKTSPDEKVSKEESKEAVKPEVSDNGKEESKAKESLSDSSDSSDTDTDKASPDATDETSADKDTDDITDATDYKKRFEDTQKWGNEANTRALKVESELKQLKIDHGIEDTPVDDTETATRLEERVKTSEAIERRIHGNEHIDKMIYADDSVWQKIKHDPLIDYRVRNSDSPITEALLVVKEAEFHTKYGDDPDTIIERVKAEIGPDLRKELKKEFEDKLMQKNSLGSDLSNVKSDVVSEADKKKVTSSTEDLFG